MRMKSITLEEFVLCENRVFARLFDGCDCFLGFS